MRSFTEGEVVPAGSQGIDREDFFHFKWYRHQVKFTFGFDENISLPQESEHWAVHKYDSKFHFCTKCSLTLIAKNVCFFRKRQSQRMNLRLPGGWDRQEVWDVHTAIFKMDNQEGPTVEPREPCSVLCDSLDGRGVWARMDTRVCMAEFLCYGQQNYSFC